MGSSGKKNGTIHRRIEIGAFKADLQYLVVVGWGAHQLQAP